jgi:hypothetical protein
VPDFYYSCGAAFPRTVLSLHADQAPPVDSSCYAPKTVTLTGTASVSTALKKFGPSSFSVANTGSSTLNGVVVTDSTDFDFGTADFCFDGWAYRNANTYTGTFFYYTDGTAPISFEVNTGGVIIMYYRSSGGTQASINTGITFPINTWQYIVVQRRYTNWQMFLHGAKPYETTISGGETSTVNSGGDLYIGRTNASSASSWDGYIDEFRLTNGASRYSFVPTAAFPNSAPADPDFASVSALLHFDNNVTDVTGLNTWTSTGTPLFPTGKWNQCIDTNSGNLSTAIAIGSALDLNTSSAWTIEFWIKRIGSFGSTYTFLDLGFGSSQGFRCYLFTSSGTVRIEFQTGTGDFLYSSMGLVADGDVWEHHAFVRNGASMKAYRNGAENSSAAIANTTAVSSTAIVTTQPNALIDDLRITKGVARYPAGFTPPSQPNCDST